MKNTLDALSWRYAVKAFDPQKKLTEAQLDLLLEALRLSPSSFGLQPWEFIVVKDSKIREKLKAAAWNQPQITEASDLLVLAVKTTIDLSLVEKFFQSIVTTRNISMEYLAEYRKMVEGFVTGRTPTELREWATRQVYIAQGVLLTAAACEGIDACPMEGFDSKQFDEILGLSALGLASVVCVPVGFRSAEDKYATLPKVRFPREEVVMEV